MRPSSLHALVYPLDHTSSNYMSTPSPPASAHVSSSSSNSSSSSRNRSPPPQEGVRSGQYTKRPFVDSASDHSYRPAMAMATSASASKSVGDNMLRCDDVQFESYREVWMLVITAYMVSILLFAIVLFWTAGDACLYYGYSYLDYRFGRLNHTYNGLG